MGLQEFYDVICGDYIGVKGRINKDTSIVKYLKRFIDDSSYDSIISAYEAKDYRKVFEASHSMKGLCANLGMTKLQEVVSNLCESVRYGNPSSDIMLLVEAVKNEYELSVSTIEKLEQ